MIHVENLAKTFRVHQKEPGLWGSLRSLVRRQHLDKVAVAGATFDVGEGEIVGLLGANGAGKTTLVKMLAGIIHPTTGTAQVLGHLPWRRDNALRQQIALIMGQKASLWWDLPAADCFLLLQEIYRLPRERYLRSLAYLTEVLDVGAELNIQIRRLSLGERMKMELIAALLHEPRVVYLDEPTIGLDLSAQRAIRDFILQYRRQHAPAMILTSHYMEDIERLCERIIILRSGEIVFDGRLTEVVERFAEHKIIKASLRKREEPLPPQSELATVGEILAWSDLEVKLRVPRSDVAPAAARVLERLPVADLTIEETEIGAIIERIQSSREDQR